MAGLVVQILSGAHAGRRAAVSASPATFGRDDENALVITGQFVSRRHGVLRIENGAWVMEVQSQNGAQINGRNVRRPTPLSNGDTVSVGGEPIFRVVAADVAEPSAGEELMAAGDQPAAPDDRSRPKVSRKTMLWLGIGGYLVLMLLLMVFLKTLQNDPDTSIKAAERLSERQIEAEVRRPPARASLLDERRARESLLRAREKLDQRHTAPDALYQAYRAYQDALRYAGRETFEEGIDQRRYQEVQDELVDTVRRLYNTGYTQLIDGNFRAASDTFLSLTQRWPDDTGEIFQNVQKQRKLAKEYERKARRRR